METIHIERQPSQAALITYAQEGKLPPLAVVCGAPPIYGNYKADALQAKLTGRPVCPECQASAPVPEITLKDRQQAALAVLGVSQAEAKAVWEAMTEAEQWAVCKAMACYEFETLERPEIVRFTGTALQGTNFTKTSQGRPRKGKGHRYGNGKLVGGNLTLDEKADYDAFLQTQPIKSSSAYIRSVIIQDMRNRGWTGALADANPDPGFDPEYAGPITKEFQDIRAMFPGAFDHLINLYTT